MQLDPVNGIGLDDLMNLTSCKMIWPLFALDNSIYCSPFDEGFPDAKSTFACNLLNVSQMQNENETEALYVY